MEELIHVLTQQRNTALDALARVQAQLLQAQKRIQELESPCPICSVVREEPEA